jgi:hypothetical protein
MEMISEKACSSKHAEIALIAFAKLDRFSSNLIAFHHTGGAVRVRRQISELSEPKS